MKIKEYTAYTNDIIISDGCYMTIENFLKIDELSDVLISVKAKDFRINIWGSELSAEFYCGKNIYITGSFQKIEFEPRGEKKCS